MKRPSFTIVEVLVIIAVIALLIAIASPALQSARRHTKAAICSMNIKRLTEGLLMYEAANDSFPYGFDVTPMVPPPGGYAGNAAFDRRVWWWFNLIGGFYTKSGGKKTVLRCPSKKLINPRLKNNILCGNYGVNLSICKRRTGGKSPPQFTGEPLARDDIQWPAKTLLIVDSGYSIINWWQAAENPPVSLDNTMIEDAAYIPGLWINRDRKLWPGQERDAINGRHPNKTVNIGFADGHLRRVKADELLAEKTVSPYTSPGPFWLPQ